MGDRIFETSTELKKVTCQRCLRAMKNIREETMTTPDEKYTREWNGETLKLRARHADLFDAAHRMYDRLADFAEIMQLALDPKSAIWLDDSGQRLTGPEVIKLPLYQAIKNMARRRGVADGFLREDAGGEVKPSLDDFLHDPRN